MSIYGHLLHLLDTNVIIRFLVGDDEKFLIQSSEYFKDIERAPVQVEILQGVLMEAFFCTDKVSQST